MAHLLRMTQEYFEAYVERSIPDYAAEHVRAGNWEESQALEKARASYQELLPDGLATKDHFLYTIEGDSEKGTAGLLWFAVDRSGARPKAFVYDLFVEESCRRKGYAQAAMLEMEDKLRAMGVTRVALHVFGHNPGAMSLYRRIGYETADLIMAKEVKPEPDGRG